MGEFIDQREPGHDLFKSNPYEPVLNHNDKKVVTKITTSEKLELLMVTPEYKEDVLYCNDINHKFSHRMDALNHCISNKIPFLVWNDIMYDWNNNIISIKYWDLPNKSIVDNTPPSKGLLKNCPKTVKLELSLDDLKIIFANDLGIDPQNISLYYNNSDNLVITYKQ